MPRILILLSGYLGAGALVTHSFLAMLSAPCRPGTVLDGVLDTSPQGARSLAGRGKTSVRGETRWPWVLRGKTLDPDWEGVVSKLLEKLKPQL